MKVDKIVIVGCGIIGKLAKASLKEEGINIYAFFDSNKQKQGGSFLNERILNEAELDNLDKNTLFLVAHNYFKSTKNFLNQKDFSMLMTVLKFLVK